MNDVPTIEPEPKRALKSNLMGLVFTMWPLNQLDVNPAYRLTLFVILKVLGLLSFFQIALIAGAPLGRAAWGGQYDVLPTALRIGSGVSILIYLLVMKIALDRTSQSVHRVIRRRTTYFVRLITIYFYLGVVLNFMSGSGWEKFVMAPVALTLAICYSYLARRPKITDDMVHVNS